MTVYGSQVQTEKKPAAGGEEPYNFSKDHRPYFSNRKVALVLALAILKYLGGKKYVQLVIL